MQSGPSTDILTNQPLEKTTSDRAAQKQAEEERLLKAKAAFIGISTSEAAQIVIAMIQTSLNQRIDALLRADAESQAYMKLLTDMAVRENQAEKAAARIVNMKINPR